MCPSQGFSEQIRAVKLEGYMFPSCFSALLLPSLHSSTTVG
jgi:hypothetical protein